ncbi:MAG: 3-methyladenine DNA glycosylase [Methanobrevibacter sp.]|jgi:N-glycosylase/DNA lyase|nr:3-methyladenine DNA glycosylase [Candidatus Methanoflexus mossambicus]
MKIDSKIDIQMTQESGQTSQPPWKMINNSYCSLIFPNNTPILLKISQNNINSLNITTEFIDSSNEKNNEKKPIEIAIKKKVSEIFNLDFDLDKFYKFLKNDDKLAPASEFCNGLRLFIAKDPFECIISSISSANNSILRWTKSIDEIAFNWGDIYKFKSGTFFSFPKPEVLKDVFETPEDESKYYEKPINICLNNLKECGVGYRSPYILQTSEKLTNEIAINDFFKMKYDEAYETIIKFKGVGPKVADCILLYGFGFMEAFPTDVWIKRIISHLYFNKKEITAEKVKDFGMEHYGDYAGYTQLYLFHYARKSGLLQKLKK